MNFVICSFSAIRIIYPGVHHFPCSWLPVYIDKDQQLGIMSIGFLVGNEDDAVVWRGPKKNGVLFYLNILLKILAYSDLLLNISLVGGQV